MKVIDVSKPAPERITCLVYGDSRGGKTMFAASFPRPIFLSDSTEGGHETIRNMNKEWFFEPGRYPEVVAIESVQDMMKMTEDLQVRIQKKPGEIQTVVIDSLTFYAELLQDTITKAMAGSDNKYAIWEKIRNNIRSLMIRIHSLPVNVVWTALAKINDDGRSGGPLLSGQMQQKAPAMCNYLLYQHCYQTANQPPVFETRTRKFGPYMAGGRASLPDPLPECSYRALYEAITGNKDPRKGGVLR